MGAVSPKLRTGLLQATIQPAPIVASALTEVDRGRSAQVYYTLATLVRGKALDVAKKAENGNGYEAWRLLIAEYEPRSKGRWGGMLGQVLTFVFGADVGSTPMTLKRPLGPGTPRCASSAT